MQFQLTIQLDKIKPSEEHREDDESFAVDWWDVSDVLETVTHTREAVAVGSTGTVKDKAGNIVGEWKIV